MHYNCIKESIYIGIPSVWFLPKLQSKLHVHFLLNNAEYYAPYIYYVLWIFNPCKSLKSSNVKKQYHQRKYLENETNKNILSYIPLIVRIIIVFICLFVPIQVRRGYSSRSYSHSCCCTLTTFDTECLNAHLSIVRPETSLKIGYAK